MIYIDTSVIVAYVNPRDPLHGEAAKLVEGVLAGSELVASQLTVVELYAVFSRTMPGLSDVELEALVEYSLRRCGVRVVDVEFDRVVETALRSAYALRLRALDLLHVSAAAAAGAKAVATLDKEIASRRSLIRRMLGLEVYAPPGWSE